MSELSSQKCGCRGKMMNTGEEHVSVSRFSFEVHGINLYGWTGDGQSVHSEVIRFLNSAKRQNAFTLYTCIRWVV